MARHLPPWNAAQLRNFARHEKDQAFLRRYMHAVGLLISGRAADRDVLWQFRAAILRRGTPDESFIPRARLHRCKFKTWRNDRHAMYYAMLHGIIWNWWHYTNGEPGFEHEKKRERHRWIATAGLSRLWAVLKRGEVICGQADRGFYLRGKVLEKTDTHDQQESNSTCTQSTAADGKGGVSPPRTGPSDCGANHPDCGPRRMGNPN